MNILKPMTRLEGPASVGFGSAAYALIQPAGISMMKTRLLSLILFTSVLLLTAETKLSSAQVIDCPSGFNTTTSSNGACGVSPNGAGADFWIANGPSTILSGTASIVAPAGAGHTGNSLIKQVKVNNQAFVSTFTFVPNGQNMAFVLENQTNQNGQLMSSGAGGEGGFSQFAGGSNIAPNNVFALMFDSYDPLNSSSIFTYSSVQIYQTLQAPYIPLQDQPGYLPQYVTNKISTYPVQLDLGAILPGTTTGDTYSATVAYDGATLTLNMFNVNAGGSCPGTSCFTHSWTGVYIPEITGATTSYVGFMAGTSGLADPYPLKIGSFTYTVKTPTGTPSYTAWNADSTSNTGTSSAASPVYSIAPGTYSGTQTVSISTSTSPHNYICYALSSTTPTLYPHPDSNGGCNTGTLYTSPVSISSSTTLYAMAGSNNSAFSVGTTNPAGLGPPSTLVAGSYTIGGGSTAATPTFSPAGGTLTPAQNVTLSDSNSAAAIYYTADGTTPTVSSNRYVSPVTLDSSATLKAVAVAAGAADSAIASANYTVSSSPDCPSTSIIPYIYTGGKWTEATTVVVGTTSTLVDLGPQPTGGTWSWAGPGGYTSTSRQINSIPLSAGTNTYTATYTSSTGCKSIQAFTVIVGASAINFADGFADVPTTIEPIGNAYYSNGTIQLTSLTTGSASNAYFTIPVNVQAFTTTFTWTAKCPTSSQIGCGDGMGFVIISTTNPYSPNYWSGGSGGALSWSECSSITDCTALKSVLVKFDLYNNQTGTAGANLTGYYTGGEYPQYPNPQYDMAPSGINMQSGHLMRATLTYDGTVLHETVIDTVTAATYTNQYTTNIPSLVGGNTAIVGFAGGTGAAEVQQNIASWTYTVN